MKKFSPNAILALKEVLPHIYWKNQDFRSFVYHALENKVFISTIDWDNNKKAESAGILVDRMVERPDLFEKDLFTPFDVTMHFDDFSHLKQWEDAETKIKRAKDAVAALRNHAAGYFQLKEEKEKIEARLLAGLPLFICFCCACGLGQTTPLMKIKHRINQLTKLFNSINFNDYEIA